MSDPSIQDLPQSGAVRPTGLQRHYYRRGPDYRHGDDVDFNDIKQQFSLATVKVGRWVTAAERQLAANLVFDAMADLAFILNVPPDMLGLKQTLHLAFGSGGRPGSQAHYAPYERTLALAKNAGAGALAHEFWHAFDHYMADKLFVDVPAGGQGFASSLWLADHPQVAHPLNQRLDALLAAVLVTEDGQECHEYVIRAVALDRAYGRRYFSIPTELLARAFEAYIQDQSAVKNHYLVSGTRQSELAKSGAFPDGAHLQRIGKCCRDYFSLLGRALTKTG